MKTSEGLLLQDKNVVWVGLGTNRHPLGDVAKRLPTCDLCGTTLTHEKPLVHGSRPYIRKGQGRAVLSEQDSTLTDSGVLRKCVEGTDLRGWQEMPGQLAPARRT